MELNKKRNQQKESSCNTCGGRFLVDGIGSISANMLSTVRLEVSNSINPELNWKKVTKGRRSRKPTGRSLNWGGKLKNQSPKRVGDFSGFDSDKVLFSTSLDVVSYKGSVILFIQRLTVNLAVL